MRHITPEQYCNDYRLKFEGTCGLEAAQERRSDIAPLADSETMLNRMSAKHARLWKCSQFWLHLGYIKEDIPRLPIVFVHTGEIHSSLAHISTSPVIYTPTFAMTVTPVSTTADLFYALEPEGGVRAYQRVDIDPSTRERVRNFEVEAKSVVIENVRGKEDSVSLDTAGFQFYKHTSKHKTFDNDEEIRREYYPESVELIKKLTGASRVELFDHSKRLRSCMYVLPSKVWMDCAI